jgi:hypothetical protein
MAMLSDKKNDENPPENTGKGGHGLFGHLQ